MASGRSSGGGGSTPPPEEEYPSNYIPGSTYIPPAPQYVATDAGTYAGAGAGAPAPAPYYPPVQTVDMGPPDKMLAPMDPTYVPGSGGYASSPSSHGRIPITPSPGLGGSGENEQPRNFIPGSTYRPVYPYDMKIMGAPPAIRHIQSTSAQGPDNYVPGSTYVPPGQRPVTLGAERNGVNPAYSGQLPIPGSTAVPTRPEKREVPPPGAYPPAVPGSGRFGTTWNTAHMPLYAGLGAYAEPHPAPAPRDPRQWAIDPRNYDQPQDFIPGSTYDPQYILQPPLGDERRMYHAPNPSELYGGVGTLEDMWQNFSPTQSISGKRLIVTDYPASGAPSTMRPTGYFGQQGRQPEQSQTYTAPSGWTAGEQERQYPFDPRNSATGMGDLGLQPPPPMYRSEQMAMLEDARRRRLAWLFKNEVPPELAGLFGGS